MAQYELATRIDPLAPIINRNLSMNEFDRGRTEAATQRLLRLLQVPRPSYHTYHGLEVIYRQTGRLVDVNKISRDIALLFARNDGRAWVRRLAISFTYLGMWQQAEAWYEYLEHSYEEVYRLQAERLFLLLRQGRLEEMGVLSSSMLESLGVSPSDMPPILALDLGTALAMAGDFSGSIEVLGQALDFESSGEVSFYDAGAHNAFQAYAWALVMVGDVSGAEEVLAKLEENYLDRDSKGGMYASDLRFSFAQNALLAGDQDSCLNRLQLAVDAGWRDYFLLMHDPRWAPMQDNPRFQKIMATVKADIDAQRAEVELIDAEDDLLARIDAAIAEYEARTSDQ